MITAERAREELEKVSSLVLTARRLVAGGTLVDLSAMEERVRAIVDAVQSMPIGDSRELLDGILALIGRLDRLGEELTDHLDQVTTKLDGKRD